MSSIWECFPLRLLSLYNDIFARKSKTSYKKLERALLRKLRQAKRNIDDSDSVRFEEFIRYVIQLWKQNNAGLDVILQPMSDLCLTCSVSYDFIGSVDTFHEDVQTIFPELLNNPTQDVRDAMNTQRRYNNTNTLEHYSDVPADQLDDLRRMYGADFGLHDFNTPL